MDNKDILYPIRRLHGIAIEWKNKIKYLKEIFFPIGKKYFIIATPEHRNLGDSAIVLAEINFLQKSGIEKRRIKEITCREYEYYSKQIRLCVKKNDVICLHGGGNMGDVWIWEEYLRRRILEELPKNKIIIFPQTIDYSNTEKGLKERKESIKYYNSERLVLVAREKYSYDIFNQLYPLAKKILTPDIVLSSQKEDYGIFGQQERQGVLFCMRNDKERAMTDHDKKEIERFIEILAYPYAKTDMYSSKEILDKSERTVHVKAKMMEFAKAELVITDRLHGMVFSALTGTPCVVFSNSNQKVKGTYEWIQYLPYVRYAESVEEAKKYIPELLQKKNCYFDNSQLSKYFIKLSENIN